jgi:hypothetical protein
VRIELFCFLRDGDRAVLARNLAASPDVVAGRAPLHLIWNPTSAAAGCNAALDAATGDVAVILHADVYLPAGWVDRLAAALGTLDADWAVAGCIGRDAAGALAGRVHDVQLGRVIGSALDAPRRAAALDECVLVLRRAAGLRVDPALPDFHFHGAELVLASEARGMGAWVLDLPVVHNNKPYLSMPSGFARAYRFVARKWPARLPRPGMVADLDARPWVLWGRLLRIRYRGTFRRSTINFRRLEDPGALARRLGWEREPAFGKTGAALEAAQAGARRRGDASAHRPQGGDGARAA